VALESRKLIAVDQEVGDAPDEIELRASNPGERFERGTRRPAAIRAMAVSGIFKLIGHLVLDPAAETFSSEPT